MPPTRKHLCHVCAFRQKTRIEDANRLSTSDSSLHIEGGRRIKVPGDMKHVMSGPVTGVAFQFIGGADW